jgi:hypothetical protein
MLLSAVSVLVVTQSSSEIQEGLMNNPVYVCVCVCVCVIQKPQNKAAYVWFELLRRNTKIIM